MDIWNFFRRVNRMLLPVKCHYFLFMAGLASALPFRTVFAKQLGISATAVGVIFCAVPFFKVVSNSLCGFVIDYFKRFRLTISVIMVVVALTHVAMVFIPPLSVKNDRSVHFNKKLFHSRLVYSCDNETFLGGENRHNVEFYTYYSQLQYPLSETGKFICDMKCSVLTKDVLQQKQESKQECEKDPTFEFTIYATLSNNNVDVKLHNGKILSGRATFPVISKFNESSITSFACWSSFSNGNCSSILQEPNIINVTRFDNGIEREIKQPSSNELDIEDSSGISKNTSGETQTYLKSGRKHGYYTLHKYTIKSPSEACNYALEYDCFIKQCTSNVSRKNDDLERLNASENEFLSVQFWILFILIALSSIAFSAIMLTMDTVCYEMLQEKKGNYGHQRLWGSVGWGLGALAGGYLNEIISPDSAYIDYSPGFYLLALLTIVDLIPIYHLEVTDVKYSSHIWKDVCFLLSKANILYNIIVVFFIGILSGFIWNYQFWFMEEIGASQVLLGLSQTFECMFEILCFLASGWVIRKIGHANSNNVTFLCFGLRYLSFAFMYNPWLTLPVGILHGPTFGLFYASMTMYAKEQAPPGTEATVQSLLHSCFEGLGVAVGSILGGIGIDNLGSRSAFMYAAEISFILLFINILAFLWSSRSKRKMKVTVYYLENR